MSKITKLIITLVIYVLIILYFLISHIWKSPVNPKRDACEIFDARLSNEIRNYFESSLPSQNAETSSVSIEELISEGLLTSEDLQDVGSSCSGNAYITKVNNEYYYYNDITCGKCSINNMYTDWSSWEESLPDFGGRKYQVMVNVLYNYSTSNNSKENWTEWSDWGESIEKIKAPSMPAGAEAVNTETEEKKQYRYRTATFKWYKISGDVVYYNGDNYYSETAPSGYEKLESSKRVLRTTKTYSTQEELRSKESIKDGDEIKAVMGYRVRTTKHIYSNTISQTTSTYQVPGVATTQINAINICKSQQSQWASSCKAYCSTSTGTVCTKYGYKYTVIANYLKSNGTTTPNRAEADYLSEAEVAILKKANPSLAGYIKVGNPTYVYQASDYVEGTCPTGSTCSTSILYKAIIYEYKWYKKVGTGEKIMCNNGALSALSPESGCIKDASTAVWSEWSEYSDQEVKKTDTNEVEVKKLIRYRKSYINSTDLVVDKWYTYEEFEKQTGKNIEVLKNDKNVNLQEKIVYKYRILK